jgi:hypothetical protein
MTTDIKIIGFTDKVNTCDCCGRSDLKGTYCISIDGVELYYGVSCAANATNYTTEVIKKEVKKIDLEKSIAILVLEASNEYLQNKVFKLAIKKGINKSEFLLKYGVVIDQINSSKCYQYGSYNSYIEAL